MEVTTVARVRSMNGVDPIVSGGRGVVKAVGATRTTAFRESAIVRGDDDGGTVVS